MEMISAPQLWTGRVLSAIVILFFLADALAKLFRVEPVLAGATQLGYPVQSVVTMGVLLLVGTILYAFPKTAVIGAIYLTGFLGGAVATHFRVGSPLLTHQLFSIYVALFMWGGLVLRKPKLLAVILGN
jgi:hypothetical protein